MKPFFMFKCVLLLASCACESFAVTIGMKPLRDSDAGKLPEVNGIYFEPMGSNDYACHNDIPRDCDGTIAVDLSKDSSITIDWVASDSNPVDKYISLRGAEENTVNFEFRAMYECNGDESYQVIEGDSISYTFDYFPNTPAVGEFSYIQANSFIELGKFGSMCGIFVRMEFGAGPSGELNLDIKKASFTANYDNTKVVQGSKAHVVSTTKFNWIDFGSTASATSISFDVKRIPIYPSSSPTDPPTGSPTVSSRPTTTPTYTPAPTKSSAPTASPTEKVITIRDATSGSKYCSTHFMVSTVGVMMAALFNMF